jgi:hypothetical protein
VRQPFGAHLATGRGADHEIAFVYNGDDFVSSAHILPLCGSVG